MGYHSFKQEIQDCTCCFCHVNQVCRKSNRTQSKFIKTDGGEEYLGDLTPFLKNLDIEHHQTPSKIKSDTKSNSLKQTVEKNI